MPRYIKKADADGLRKQICTVYENNGDWRGLANALNVKRSTAYRWVKNKDAAPKQRGGKRRTKITDVHREYIVNYIEENPRLTLKELKHKFEENHEVIVSTECLRQHLDGLMYTLKNVRREPEKTNSLENKTKRRDYVQQLLNYQADNMPIIYMDETNFNLFISRQQGRSKKGSRCSYIAAGSRGSNIHLIGCIGTMGLIHYEIRRGAFKKPQANEFVRNLLRIAQNMYNSNVVLVVDNAPCHRDFEEVFAQEEFINNRLLRLSPYSPMLNPIESAWSSLKSGVKRDLSTILPRILAGNQLNISQTEFRLRQLEAIVIDNIPTININNCVKFIAHVQRFIPDAINLINMNM